MEFYIILLFYIGLNQASIITDLKQGILNWFATNKAKDELEYRLKDHHYRDNDKQGLILEILKKPRYKDKINEENNISLFKLSANPGNEEYSYKDPMVHHVQRRTGSNEELSSSTSIEIAEWNEEFKQQRVLKKIEAINSSTPLGHIVNMAAVRPWGVPCGDINQHDLPWGSCMTAIECEAEFRIYGGDIFCGKSEFVCCALQVINYDLYQGFDVSFATSSSDTDTQEKKERKIGSKELKKKKKAHEKRRIRMIRKRRKRSIKRKIRIMAQQIRKILNRAFRNSTRHRMQRTKLLQKYIQLLKSKYKQERQAIKQIHNQDLERIDTGLEERLKQIRDINSNFMINKTFRHIIINKTIPKTGARILIEAYPELKDYLVLNDLRRARGEEAGRGYSEDDVYNYNEYELNNY